MRVAVPALLSVSLAVVTSCAEPSAGPVVAMRFDDPHVFAAPFPSEHLRRADGTLELSSLPRGNRVAIVDQIHEALSQMTGFGTTSAIHLSLDVPLDPASLPTGIVEEGVVELIDVERGTRAPIRLFFVEDGGPFGAENVLTALPVQGMPLRGEALYALVVRRGLRAADGRLFDRAPALEALARGQAPAGLAGDALAAYREAFAALGAHALDPDSVIAMSAFRTQDPTRSLRRAVQTTSFAVTPEAPFEPAEIFDDYCVYRTTMRMPVYQAGEPPYLTTGGAWVWNDDGTLALQREEEANVWVTLPRRPMPAEGFPLTVLVRTGAGGDRPLVDRGPRAVAHGPSIAPGTGPAMDFARIGWAGLQVDGPHGGLRNVSMGDEQFLVFNIQNPTALRDNLRQSALELVLLARALDDLVIDASACPGLEEPAAHFDVAHVALMGHSMGASIAPLAAAFEPRYHGLILSGAGASWLENVLYKESPLATRPIAETLLGYTRIRRTLREDDPVLSLLQWAGEEADAAVYAPLLLRDAPPGQARHILMFQGIVDTYIPPQVANALTLALGIDLAGQALDVTSEELVDAPSVLEVLPLRGRSDLPYPVVQNLAVADERVTAVVAQHLDDGIEDGHETMWQTQPPRAQFRCFLDTMMEDRPVVPGPMAPCR
ncbi:MAG: hypothetical protein OHK0013_42350 [Sandaracinaceae bacterium]